MKTWVCIMLITMTGFICSNAKQNNASETWNSHGDLKISENGRYFIHEDGTPFLWLGGTVWGFSEWLNREDVDLYLDNRKEKGVNVVQMCLIWGKRRDPGGFTLNDENAYGHRALLYTDELPDPAKPDTVAGGTPTDPNDYWDHVEYILKAAEERDMYMAVLPVWGRRYVNAVHKGASKEIFTVENANIHGEFLGKRFKSSPNIIWVMGGDVKPVQGNKGINKLAVYRSMAEGIMRGVTGKEVAWNDDNPARHEVFITYHPNGEPYKNSSDFFHTEPWLDFNMIETFVNRDQVYDAVLRDYFLDNPAKPTVQGEPNYEGHTPGADVYAKPIHIRRQAYHSFFAGAAGFTYGAHEVEGLPGPLFSPSNEWKKLLDLKGAQALPVLRKFLEEQKWYEWVPDTTLVIENKGKGEKRIVGIRVPDKNKFLVYFPANREAAIQFPDDIEAEKLQLTWFNTADGTISETQEQNASETVSLIPPENMKDAVAIMKFK